ncbi:MAG: hypothetical protein AAF349_25210 [Cyanobacteria bacterium P01_A01_bin.68]
MGVIFTLSLIAVIPNIPTFQNIFGELSENEGIEYQQALTCLETNNGKEIENCPNCGQQLVEFLEEDDADLLELL